MPHKVSTAVSELYLRKRTVAPRRRNQAEPGGARRSQEEPGGARGSQEEPGGAMRSQEDPAVKLVEAF